MNDARKKLLELQTVLIERANWRYNDDPKLTRVDGVLTLDLGFATVSIAGSGEYNFKHQTLMYPARHGVLDGPKPYYTQHSEHYPTLEELLKRIYMLVLIKKNNLCQEIMLSKEPTPCVLGEVRV